MSNPTHAEPLRLASGGYRWYRDSLTPTIFALLTGGYRYTATWREYATMQDALADYHRAALGIIKRSPNAATQVALVWLTGEQFPRLRTNGRLIWLGSRMYPNQPADYHDPDLGGEMIDGVWVTDSTQFALSLPDGITIDKELFV